jgi:hypothetical protein
MTSFLDKGGSVAIRMGPEGRHEFIEACHARVAVQHGKELKQSLVVPDDLLEDPNSASQWLRRSWEWVGSLRPKKV